MANYGLDEDSNTVEEYVPCLREGNKYKLSNITKHLVDMNILTVCRHH